MKEIVQQLVKQFPDIPTLPPLVEDSPHLQAVREFSKKLSEMVSDFAPGKNYSWWIDPMDGVITLSRWKETFPQGESGLKERGEVILKD